jgi:hypothetical protein
MAIKRLADYIRAIQGMHSDAVIQRETETFDDVAQPGTCMPCLVYYRVLTNATTDIRPQYKRFDNQCQARFWALLNT